MLGQRRAGLKLVDHDALHLKAIVVIFLQLLDLGQQAVEGISGKAVAVKGNQAAISRDQRRNRIEIERRRRIQVDPLVVSVQVIQQFAQLVDLVLGLELGLQVGQLGCGGYHVQVVVRGFVDIHLALAEGGGRQRLLEEVGYPHGNILTGQAGEVVGGIGLGVEVDQQGAIALRSADRRQVAGDAGLAHATFLIEHHSPHHTPPQNLISTGFYAMPMTRARNKTRGSGSQNRNEKGRFRDPWFY
ncbi:hypothetical protein D3C84_482860 [compost metagenome]